MAAPPPPQNFGQKRRAHAKRWQAAILKALARLSRENADAGLERMATLLVRKAFNGDEWAINHIADRIDGKPAQAIELGAADEIPSALVVTFGRVESQAADDRVPAETRVPVSH